MNEFTLNADGHEIGTVSIAHSDSTGFSKVTIRIGEVEQCTPLYENSLLSIRRLIASALSAADEHPKYISLGWHA